MSWSRDFAACIRCDGTERPHHAKGLCRTCYQQQPDYRERYNASKMAKRSTPEGKARQREHYLRNRDTIIGRVMDRYWSSADYRFSLRVSDINRRARLAGCDGIVSVDQARARIAFYGGSCYLCGADWEHLDHVKPLSEGGPNLASNLRPACATCNGRKGSNWDGPKALAHA